MEDYYWIGAIIEEDEDGSIQRTRFHVCVWANEMEMKKALDFVFFSACVCN